MTDNKISSFVASIIALLMASGIHSMAHAVKPINISLYDIDVSQAERERLQKVLDTFFSESISVISERNVITTVRLTNKKETSMQWYRSRFQLPSLPSFAVFTLRDRAPSNGITAILKRPYIMITSTIAYPVDTNEAALTMLSGRRVDGIIDYAANIAMYVSNNQEVEYQILRDETPLFIEFSSKTELYEFERAVYEAQQNERSTPFINTLTASNEAPQTPIRIFALNKLFDNDSKKLRPINEEISAAQWWDDMLSDYSLTLDHASSSEAFAAMSEGGNVCILNVYKNAEREKLAYFSKPAVFYLKPRIYAPASSEKALKLKTSMNDKPINFSEWSPREKGITLGYSNIVQSYLANIKVDTYIDNQEFINLDEIPYERVNAMLKSNIVDFIIEYPSRLKQLRAQVGDTSSLINFEIENATTSTPAYIACNRSSIGRDVISAINFVLSDATKIGPLIDIYTDGFSASEIEKYTQDALQVH